MKRFIWALALIAGAAMGMATPSSAVELMVAGNSAREAGLSQEAVQKKLKTLMSKFFSYDGVNPILQSADLPKRDFEARFKQFEEKMAGADFVMFYYLGLGVHDALGGSYLVPAGWNGNKDELIDLSGITSKMRELAGGKSLLILDTVEPAPQQWKHDGIDPGLGDIDREARAGGVLIAYNHELLAAGKDGTVFATSLEKRVSGPLQLKQLASLVQEDVSFETSGTKVPRLTGAIDVSLQLNEAAHEESTEKKKQMCKQANAAAEEKIKYASAGGTVGAADAAQSSEKPQPVSARSNRNDFFFPWFFCPFESEPEYIQPKKHVIIPKREPQEAPRHPAPSRPAPSYARSYGGGGGGSHSGGGGGGGGAAVRAALPGG